MRRLAVGILAHVDAGKTTLSEALLYRTGCLRRLGRVDHGDAFLDTAPLERERGITIFSKQAVLPLGETELTLLDTPGHVDFSAEMERTLRVLDCAILVISGTDGVQGHTRTLWRLLEQYGVPTFVFINKMDLPGADRAGLLAGLKRRLGDGCTDFGAEGAALLENVAVCDEAALERYLEAGTLSDGEVAGLVGARKLFPCYFGSALRLEGVDALLEGLERYGPRPDYPPEFGARVYKISRDAQGGRLTHLKVTGGRLRVKDLLTNRRADLGEEQIWEEKADQIRIYSGERYRVVEEVPAGTIATRMQLPGSWYITLLKSLEPVFSRGGLMRGAPTRRAFSISRSLSFSTGILLARRSPSLMSKVTSDIRAAPWMIFRKRSTTPSSFCRE